MVLLDSVAAWSEGEIDCRTRSHLRPDNPLRRGGRLAAVCGVEYGAQAMAVHGGLLAGGERPGYLASLRDVALYTDRLDTVEDELAVRATVLLLEPNRLVYAFAVDAGDRPLLGGRAAVFLI